MIIGDDSADRPRRLRRAPGSYRARRLPGAAGARAGDRRGAALHALRDALHQRRRSASHTSRRWPAESPPSAVAASPVAEEIAAAGDGMVLVPPGDIERLTQRIDELLSDPQRLRRPASALARRSPRTSPGSAAAGRLSPPTSARCCEARPLRDRARARLPSGGVRAASTSSRDVEFALFAGPSLHGGSHSRASCPFRTATCALISCSDWRPAVATGLSSVQRAVAWRHWRAGRGRGAQECP